MRLCSIWKCFSRVWLFIAETAEQNFLHDKKSKDVGDNQKRDRSQHVT